jgi:hypothetical protein
MAGITALNFEIYWHKKVEALREAYKEVMVSHLRQKRQWRKYMKY